MRVVSETTRLDLKITIYNWNNKYLLKFENGLFEQTYKVSALDVTGDSDLLNILDDELFLAQVKQSFTQMEANFSDSLNRVV
ncbi:MAG: hypothetical protein EAZ07_02190 [Cytophagales bacterium]|nr:MAG: hypothetical protein EAZ07_02190 [Cytophagales bacterium]